MSKEHVARWSQRVGSPESACNVAWGWLLLARISGLFLGSVARS
jgi:hypothetical protein